MRTFTLLFLALFAACRGAGENTGAFLLDEAKLLSRTQVNRIRAYHEQLLRDLDIHFKVAILRESPPSIEDTAIRLFADYSLGSRTRGAKGLLLIIDPQGRQTRIETGYDLEPIFPDAFAGYVQRGQMAPFYRSGRIAEGVEATVELLVTRTAQAIDRNAYDPDVPRTPLEELSGGAGASLRLGAAESSPAVARQQADAQSYGPQPSVEAAFSTYLRILENRIREPRLGIYSEDTQDFLETRLVTTAQQTNELAEIRAMYARRIVRENGNLAVIRFPESTRVPPYFFRKQDTGWTIDLAVMMRVIGFDTLNQWYLRDEKSEFSPLIR